MTIDYEAEYNNRARVPEHPQIFERWARDAAAYRQTPLGRGELGLSYGPSERRIVDLFAPAGEERAPLAMFVHGGYWATLEPARFSHLARGLNARGVAVAFAGYDLCPQVAIADIIHEMRQAALFLWRRTRRRVLAFGHSAGGHLSACLLATDWNALAPDAPADLVPAAYAISGVYDLTPMTKVGLNQALRLTEEEARRVSPLFWPVPVGRAIDVIVGGAESSEFIRQSRALADAWRQGPVETRFEEVPGQNHFTILDPFTDPDSAMVARVVELANKAA